MVKQVFAVCDGSNARLHCRLYSHGFALARKFATSCLALGLTIFSEPAGAQTAVSYSLDFFRPQTLISPTIPVDYDRGGNVSIDDTPRPGFDPLPVEIGNFRLYPEVATFIGGSSNVLLTTTHPKPDILLGARVSLTAEADWGSSNFVMVARDWENVWVHAPDRSQDQGDVDASYQIEVGDTLKLAAEGAFHRYGDNNAIGTVNNLSAVLLTTQQTFGALRAQYESGHIREIISVDREHFNLDPVYSYLTGLELNYFADHSVYHITSQTEYAFTPRVAVIGQINAYKTTYNSLIPPNIPNYDSISYRALAGLSMDVPGLLRGQISAGFGHRHYNSSLYQAPTVLVIASKVQIFPTRQDNITVVVIKDFDDGAIYSLAPLIYLSASIVYEHELRTNIIVGSQINWLKIAPIDQATSRTLPPTSDYGGSFYAKYLANRHFSITIEVGAEKNINNTTSSTVPDFAPNKEFRSLLTFSYRL